MKPLPRRAAAVIAAVLVAGGSAVAGSAPAAAEGPIGGPRLAEPGVVWDSAATPPPDLAATFVVADARSGTILAAKDAHAPRPPASTAQGADRTHGPAPARPVGGLHRGVRRRRAGGQQGRHGRGRPVHRHRPAARDAAAERQRRGARARQRQRGRPADRRADERRGAPDPGPRHRRGEHQRARRARAGLQRVRPGPDRSGRAGPPGLPGAGLAQVGGLPGGADRRRLAAAHVQDLQPEQAAHRRLPRRGRRQDRATRRRPAGPSSAPPSGTAACWSCR